MRMSRTTRADDSTQSGSHGLSSRNPLKGEKGDKVDSEEQQVFGQRIYRKPLSKTARAPKKMYNKYGRETSATA